MKYLITILIAFTLVSCGTLKKSTHKEAAQTETKQDINTTTKTVTKEKADTTVSVPGSKAVVQTPLDQLLSGDTIRARNANTSLIIAYDKASNSISAQAITEPVSVPIHINRETTTEQVMKAVTQEKTSSELTEKQVDRKESGIFNPWWLLLCLIAIAALVIFIYRLAPKF